MLGTLQEIAARVGGQVEGDGSVPVARVSAIDDASPDALTFATDEKYLAQAIESNAAAVLVDASVPRANAAAKKPLLIVENARAALAAILAALKPPRPKGPFRHQTAIVEDGAEIGEDVYLGAHSYICAGAKIGRGSVIDVGSYVGAHSAIGEDCWLHPRATVHEKCLVGNRVVLYTGSVIGSEGFGWAFLEGRLERIPQIGNVVLEDEVEIGANSCVDRAQTGSTYLGRGTKIDNLVQIGHNSRTGKYTVIAAQTGFAGSTTTGDGAKIAGQVGTRGHVHIGSGSTVAGQAGVWADIPDGETVSGRPARNHRETMRAEVMLRNLPKLIARVDALERDRAHNPE